MLQAMLNVFRLPDLRRRLLFTIFILVVFRLIAAVPVPGVDQEKLAELFQGNQFLSLVDMFAGGAMSRLSIVMMGVYPYITATIIMQLLTPIIPKLEEWQKEGEAGRQRINRIQHWMTVPLALLQAFGQISVYYSQGIITNWGFGDLTSAVSTVAILSTVIAGTVVCVWFGELISEAGIGNGVSIIILANIVARLPSQIGSTLILGQNWVGVIVFFAIAVITVVAIVMVQEGERRIPVHYAKRVRGRRIYGGGSTHVPIKVLSAGMIPLIFALSILAFPSLIGGYMQYSEGWVGDVGKTMVAWFSQDSMIYAASYFLMTIGFTYFYTMVIFEQQNLAENLQKQGGFIPGIRPGRPTQDYLMRIVNRITLFGAVFLGLVAVLPFFARLFTGVQTMSLESTSVLIVVGVVLDTMRQLEAQLLMRHYEGFIK
ncbi:MAG: preprotein translocase subunit SecY [Chloroflexi bacterium]|nr:preprotein translocase subunit SecY [Chloroflexota bacterium]MBU1750899.1 preprotein translocase subunit SecY [Chloroflexota bacterium]